MARRIVRDEVERSSTTSTPTNITATKAKPFPDGKQADILLLSITSIDNPTARNWHLDVTSTNPMGVTNQELINRADLGHQPGPGEHDPRNDVLTMRAGAQAHQVRRFKSECASQRDSALPADVLLGKLKKDISLALRRGTIA